MAWSAAKPMAMNGSTIEKYRIMAIPFQGLTMPPALFYALRMLQCAIGFPGVLFVGGLVERVTGG